MTKESSRVANMLNTIERSFERSMRNGGVIVLPSTYSEEHLASLGLDKERVFATLRESANMKEASERLGIKRKELEEWIFVFGKDEIAAALDENFGIMARVERIYHIPRYIISAWASCDVELQAAIESGKERTCDLAQEKLIELIQANGSQATTPVIFTLKTLGRGRGFYEGALTIDMGKLSEEQLKRIADGENPLAVAGESIGVTMRVK